MATIKDWFTPEDSTTVLYPCIRLEGIPEPVRNELKRVMRPGVDGAGYILKAKIGKPFTMTSYVDVFQSQVESLRLDYYNRITQVLELYWQTFRVGKVVVHNVVPQPVKLLRGTVGGLNGGDALVKTVWHLEGLAS